MGSASAQNASMYSASIKHGPAHPRDVDDFDEQSAHDLDERVPRTCPRDHVKYIGPAMQAAGACVSMCRLVKSEPRISRRSE